MTNVVVLHGRLSKPASERMLPSGDRLATLDLTVEGSETAKAESVPLAWFDSPTWVLELETGAELFVLGRVRRRFFRAGQQLQSRTEVVVEGAAPLRRPARVRELVARVRAAVAEPLDEHTSSGPRQRAQATFP